MKTIETDIEIDASPDVIWEILTDLDAYSAWNPFITEAEGTAEKGKRIRVRIEPPESRGATFRPVVLTAERNRRFEWLGRLFVPRLFDGHHQFLIQRLDDERVRFVQREEFSGVLVRVLLNTENTKAGFAAMNRALKRRAEGD